MELDFTTSDELIGLIKKINEQYYERFNANILYLEELADRIFVIYIIVLRDAYSHLVRVYDYDIKSTEGRQNIKNHLEKYIAHLQRGLIDTFRKILDLEMKSLLNTIHRKNVKAVTYGIAQKAHELRIMGKDTSIDKRIEGYLSLLEHISDIRKDPKFDK
jgi:hypothetical protein